ncbi:hypothetical protein HDU98_011569 [Podochytrium sp. JEL0797]|nr:hypothetical protein HDU98_011569 [Podochytrium sp. JEL0797]
MLRSLLLAAGLIGAAYAQNITTQATIATAPPVAPPVATTAAAAVVVPPIPPAITGPLVGKNLPPNNKIIFGAWYDPTAGAVSGNDSAAAINQRLGFNLGSFSFSQGLPPKLGQGQGWNADGTADVWGSLNDKTNAAVFLTVYPASLTGILDQDITNLANQCANITNSGRPMFVRFAPEMNGDWFPYGTQAGTPADFLALWMRVYNAMATLAPKVALVWSPNVQGPSGAYAYAPYWPGAAYVDWVGLSIYWKVYDNVNQVADPNYVQLLVDGTGEGVTESFYQDYAVQYNKPFMMSEGGAAINTQFTSDGVNYTSINPGPGQAAIMMSYWNGYLFSSSFIAAHPLFRMAVSFEIYKQKEDSDSANNFISRDYRVSVDPETRTAFSAALKQLDSQGIMYWATSNAAVTSSAPASVATSLAATVSAPVSKSSSLKVAVCFLAMGVAAVVL